MPKTANKCWYVGKSASQNCAGKFSQCLQCMEVLKIKGANAGLVTFLGDPGAKFDFEPIALPNVI